MRAERAPHGRRGDETLRRAWRMSVAASALVLLVATPLRSTAQDWVYVAERGDNLWDLATEYLVSMRYWARFRALNDVPNPRRMPPGTVIRFPVEWLRVTAAPVEITQVAGQARIVRADASSEAAAVGATLGAGDRIVTGAAASAVLAFVDGSETVFIRINTVHTLQSPAFDSRSWSSLHPQVASNENCSVTASITWGNP